MVFVADTMDEIKEYAKENHMTVSDACALFTAASTVDVNRQICRVLECGWFSVGIFNEQGRELKLSGSIDANTTVDGSIDVDIEKE